MSAFDNPPDLQGPMDDCLPGTVSVLYVEDDAATRDAVTRMLAKNGFHCIVAENGQEGLELYRRHTPEIVLSDIKMPVLGGLEMARAIRREFPEAQFIFLTAFGDQRYLLEAVEIGVAQYVVKPVVLSQLLAAIGHCVAITRLRAEAQRARHLRAIGVLASGVAHDYNNLLQIVLGYVSFAKKHLKPGSMAYSDLEMAESVAHEAGKVGKRLRTLSREETGLRLQMPLASLVVPSVQAELQGRAVTAVFDLPPDLPEVSVDKYQLQQVISQLTLNAVEAMPQGGTLAVAARLRSVAQPSNLLLRPGDYLQVTFSDTGSGIPSGDLTKIFDPYFTTKTMDFHKGRGLGLSICHSIVSMHDGLISAHNSPDAGAVVTLWLPVAEKYRRT
jgi:signal transduction histidine kinase